MPKMKTHRGAKKRFKLSKSGKVKRSHAKTNHNAGSKSNRQKRRLRQAAYASKADSANIKKLLQ